ARAPPTRPSTHVLELDQLKPYLSFRKNGKLKVLNGTGLRHLGVILLTMPLWVLAMEVVHWLGDALEDFDGDRSAFDYTGKLWCRSYLMLTNCYPEIAGDVSRLRSGRARTGSAAAEGDEKAVMFVANHSSFLDIAVLCCVLDPVFKFIAKDSLEKFPGVGRQLVGGEHVLLNRSNKRSQLKSFKQAISYLKSGIPVMAFPEGARSPDGRLMDFKGGSFSMAMKANVDIVPISIANTHAVMPGIGFLPVQEGKDKLRVFVHDAISVEGKDEVQIAREVREAVTCNDSVGKCPLLARTLGEPHEAAIVTLAQPGRARVAVRDAVTPALRPVLPRAPRGRLLARPGDRRGALPFDGVDDAVPGTRGTDVPLALAELALGTGRDRVAGYLLLLLLAAAVLCPWLRRGVLVGYVKVTVPKRRAADDSMSKISPKI
ncbi:hypothetical protein THAOC_12329, partial [Thalassiosira oceanica]